MTTAIGIDMGKFSFHASCDENDVHEFEMSKRFINSPSVTDSQRFS